MKAISKIISRGRVREQIYCCNCKKTIASVYCDDGDAECQEFPFFTIILDCHKFPSLYTSICDIKGSLKEHVCSTKCLQDWIEKIDDVKRIKGIFITKTTLSYDENSKKHHLRISYLYNDDIYYDVVGDTVFILDIIESINERCSCDWCNKNIYSYGNSEPVIDCKEPFIRIQNGDKTLDFCNMCHMLEFFKHQSQNDTDISKMTPDIEYLMPVYTGSSENRSVKLDKIYKKFQVENEK